MFFKAKTENEARALICLVYENDRCLLHIGLIKMLGIQYLLKQQTNHFHHRGIDFSFLFNENSFIINRSNSNQNLYNY